MKERKKEAAKGIGIGSAEERAERVGGAVAG